jgi:CheY-like chemotaxis protein
MPFSMWSLTEQGFDVKSALLIDDSRGARRHLRQILEPWGFDLIEADSGTAAIAIARTLAVDMIFLDMEMPGLDGVATLRTLRAMGVNAPTALVTGNANTRNIADAVKVGAADFVYKPATADSVRAVLQKLLNYDPGVVNRVRGRVLFVDRAVSPQDRERLGPCDIVVCSTFDETVAQAGRGGFDAVLLGRLDASEPDDDAEAEAEALAALLTQQLPHVQLFKLVGEDEVSKAGPWVASLPRSLPADAVDDLVWRRALGMLGFVSKNAIRMGRFSGDAVDRKAYDAMQVRTVLRMIAGRGRAVADISLMPSEDVTWLVGWMIRLRDVCDERGTELDFHASASAVPRLRAEPGASSLPISAVS